jgi:hypothetical protein
MTRSNGFVILGVGVAVVGLLAGAKPVGAQTKEARGTVTAVTETTLTLKAGAQDLTFYVDGQTHIEVRAAAKKVQQAQPGNPKPRVNDFIEKGNVLVVRYREENGRNHAIDIERAGSPGAGGGSVSDPARIAEGKVKSVTQSQLTVAADGRDFTFAINSDTDVLARGATKATKAAGGSTAITTFVHEGDAVSVSYRETAGTMTATEVRLRVAAR